MESVIMFIVQWAGGIMAGAVAFMLLFILTDYFLRTASRVVGNLVRWLRSLCD